MPKLKTKISKQTSGGAGTSRRDSQGPHNFSIADDEAARTSRRGKVIDFCTMTPVKHKAGQRLRAHSKVGQTTTAGSSLQGGGSKDGGVVHSMFGTSHFDRDTYMSPKTSVVGPLKNIHLRGSSNVPRPTAAADNRDLSEVSVGRYNTNVIGTGA